MTLVVLPSFSRYVIYLHVTYSGSEKPTGYLDWYEWAQEKAKTHVQRRNPDSGLWDIWEPRGEGAER